MFKTHAGVTENATNEIYLRPETAQGIFVNFQNVMRATRRKLPAGIAQIGKSFRNEITPGNFIFRVREFEQMELEFFCKPGEDLEWFSYWRTFCRDWLLSLGLREENLRLRDHEPEKLAFYSKATTDFEYLFPFGWGELWGVADRTDLRPHPPPGALRQEHGVPRPRDQRKVRALLHRAVFGRGPACSWPSSATPTTRRPLEGGDVRTVLHLHPALAPYKCAVLPLQKNKLGALATEIYEKLSRHFMVDYDETGSIGKRYPPPGRDRHALLRDRRFRHRRGRHRHRARPRRDDPRSASRWTSCPPLSGQRLVF